MAQRLGLRQVRALKPGNIFWDPTLPGFGARRQRSEAVAYILAYRTKEGRSRWFTIGRHGAPWTPHTAREEAVKLLGEVAGGFDPSAAKQQHRRGKTVADLKVWRSRRRCSWRSSGIKLAMTCRSAGLWRGDLNLGIARARSKHVPGRPTYSRATGQH